MNKRLFFLIALSAALPIAKQFLVVKFIVTDEVAIYGWLLSVSGLFVGFSHLGWGDSVGRKISQYRGFQNFHFYQADFKISNLSITIVSIVVLPAFLLANNIHPGVTLLLTLQVLLLSIFRNNTKILRALGLNNAFFRQMSIKNILDIGVLAVLLMLYQQIGIRLTLLSEIVTLAALVIFVIRMPYFRILWFRTKEFHLNPPSLRSTFLNEYKYPTALFLIALLSLLIEYFERFGFFYFLSSEDYRTFVFLSLHFSILLSTQALIFNLLYRKIAILQTRPPVESIRYVSRIFFGMLIVFAIGFYPAVAVLKILHLKFYPEYGYEPITLILILISGIASVLNVFETYLMTSDDYKKVLYLKFGFLMLYTLCVIIAFITYGKLGVKMALILSMIMRLLYLASCGIFFTQKMIVDGEKITSV